MDSGRLSRRGFIVGVAGMAAATTLARAGGASAATAASTSTATRYVLTTADGPSFTFSRLLALKKSPPSVTLEGVYDQGLVAWHQLAVEGSPYAKQDATLLAYDVDGSVKKTWVLSHAWVARIAFPTNTSGTAAVKMIKVKVRCDTITVQ